MSLIRENFPDLEDDMRREPGWLSRNHRDPVLLSGIAVLSDLREVAVRLTNLSPTGCRIESGETLPIGESLTLDVGPLVGVAGMVRWSLNGIAGVRFARDWT